jgi:hypothetical protein
MKCVVDLFPGSIDVSHLNLSYVISFFVFIYSQIETSSSRFEDVRIVQRKLCYGQQKWSPTF